MREKCGWTPSGELPGVSAVLRDRDCFRRPEGERLSCAGVRNAELDSRALQAKEHDAFPLLAVDSDGRFFLGEFPTKAKRLME